MRLDVSHLSHFGRHLVLALGKHKLVVYHKADIDDSESDKDMLVQCCSLYSVKA